MTGKSARRRKPNGEAGFPDQINPPERAMPPKLLKRCLAIISPAENERQLCVDDIASDFKCLVWAHVNSQLFTAPAEASTRQDIRCAIRALAYAAALMTAWPWMAPSARLATCEAEEVTVQEWQRVSEYLLSSAINLHNEDCYVKTRPVDVLKRFCAMCAFTQIKRFSAQRPTLSVDGTFYQLASALYEATTGVREVNLERHCRAIYHHRN